MLTVLGALPSAALAEDAEELLALTVTDSPGDTSLEDASYSRPLQVLLDDAYAAAGEKKRPFDSAVPLPPLLIVATRAEASPPPLDDSEGV